MPRLATAETSKQDVEDIFRRKIFFQHMTSIFSGDRELVKSLMVRALREIADDIENGK